MSHRKTAQEVVDLNQAFREDREVRDAKLKKTKGYEERLEVLREARMKQKSRRDESVDLLEQEIKRG